MMQSRYELIRRRFLEEGEFDPDLLRLLRRAVHRLVRFGGLPPMYSPTGHWDDEAEKDVLGDWLTARLLGRGQLVALLHQAKTPGSFLRLGELYLRRHLINRLTRSHATNLFGRIRDLLQGDPAFEQAAGGYWQLVNEPAMPWRGTDRELLGAAWQLGHFNVVRFREDAKKLSHVLDAEDLRRFVVGLLKQTESTLELAQIVRALVLRFDLEPFGIEPIEDHEDMLPAQADVVEEVSAVCMARAVVGELTARQVAILRCQLQDLSVRATAEEIGMAVGTVSAEQQVIAEVLQRLSDEDGTSRLQLLNALRDLLFIGDGDQ
jgi:hypothetical protein